MEDGKKQNLIYFVDPSKLPGIAGVYIFGRRWGGKIEALYVGKGSRVNARVKGQFNNLHLMQHVRNAKTGERVLIVGKLMIKRGQRAEKALALAELALIRYFLSEGHDLVNKQGTRLRRHELVSSKHPKRLLHSPIYLEKTKGE